MVCAFFGHSDASEQIYPKLKEIIKELIAKRGVTDYLVGNHGAFDSMVLRALRELKVQYSHISYKVILAYLPGRCHEYEKYSPGETLYPEGIEPTPKRFAISWRNKWMVNEAKIVVCYITRSWSGAAQFVQYAKIHDKEVINIAEKM